MFMMLMNYLMMFKRDEEGQGLVEYALIIGLIAIVVIVAITALSGQLTDIFDNITQGLAGGGGE